MRFAGGHAKRACSRLSRNGDNESGRSTGKHTFCVRISNLIIFILFRLTQINFIRLADITHDMTEPCVIDIKIGQRTWDPLASPDKIAAEEQKYQACKQNLGICIPGFQVYSVKTGSIKRYGKEFGKKLNQNTIKDGKRNSHLIKHKPV